MSTALLTSADVHLIGPLLPNGSKPDAGAAPNSGPDAEAWDHLFEELAHIRLLADDWDGQGAEAPSPANVAWAADWVRQMRQYPRAIPPSRAIPGVAGEVYLEWQGGSVYLMAEINSPTRVEWMMSVTDQPNRHWVTEGGIPYFLSWGIDAKRGPGQRP